ncbi:MAG: heavy metal-binding domain-containing protein [Phycisphaerales bacterium]|nr:heavy metal-binding domain-containing protein [Phycisphaerales bacterium]
MIDFITIALQFAVPIALILIGLVSGTILERAHLRRLDERDRELAGIVLTDTRTPPPGVHATGGEMVIGQVVISSDYFKAFIASFRKIIGGEVRSYERIMERARREAMHRMINHALSIQATTIINVRLETSSIGRMSKNPMPMVEVIAYGTAIRTG